MLEGILGGVRRTGEVIPEQAYVTRLRKLVFDAV